MNEPPKSSPPRNPKEGAQPVPAVDRRLLEMLVCPVTRQSLDYRPERQELVSRAARLAYPIRDGIPIMLAEEARELADDEL